MTRSGNRYWWENRDDFAARWESYGYNLTSMADSEGCSRGTLVKWRKRHQLEFPEHVNPKGNHANSHRRANRLETTPPLVPILESELRVEGDFSIMSDLHLPVTRYDVMNRWLDDSQHHGLSRAILPGDVFNQDAWSRHEHKQGGAGPDEEHAAAMWAFPAMLDVFDELIVAMGNHDQNAHRKLDFSVSFDRAMRMLLADLSDDQLSRITITGRDYVLVDTDEGLWRICHTRTYSRQPLAYPNRLALRHGCHVAAAHRHHHAQGFAANGKSIVELGGAHDEERMAYANRWTDDFPRMSNGYMLLIDGRAHCPMLAG